MTDWAQIFTGLLFYAYVEIHQLWRLVFDNYQLVYTAFKALVFDQQSAGSSPGCDTWPQGKKLNHDCFVKFGR